MEERIEIQQSDLQFFLTNQNSPNAWFKGQGWQIINVETITEGGGYDTRQVVWLMRRVRVNPAQYEVIDN